MARKNVRLPPEFAYLEDHADQLCQYCIIQKRRPLFAYHPNAADDFALLVEACRQIEERNDAIKIARWVQIASNWDKRRGGYCLSVLIDLMMEFGKQGHPTFIGIHDRIQTAEE